MKILKIFGVVVGIHLFALILIFANPGCSTSTRPPPSPADTVASAQPAPVITVPPMGSSLAGTPVNDTMTSAPAPAFDPDAPASYAASDAGGVRFTPTRPNTPAASAVLTPAVENVTPATTYTVKAGDSLWELQKRFHVNVREIAAANNISTNTIIRPGQKLIIPKAASSSTAAARPGSTAARGSTAATATPAPATKAASSPAARPSGGEFKYTVKPGETLGGIAHKFGVTVRELAVHNSISDPMKLRAGTEISIPGWQPTPGGTSSASSRAATASTPTSTPPPAPATTPEPKEVPNLLESAPAEPAQTPSTSVPVIDIDGQQ